jgi:staphylococcal nuclease domain-containing protein 1
MTDITDASRFYVRINSGSDYSKIEFELNRFNPSLHEDLEKPIKKGTICAARFKLDDNWYRAKVLGGVGKGEYEVQFIDFGNSDTVNGNSGDLKKLPDNLLQFPP